MKRQTTIFIPKLEKKIKSKEFATIRSGLVVPGLAGATQFDDDAIQYAIGQLEKGFQAYKTRLRQLRESKGQQLFSILDTSGTVLPVATRPYNEECVTIMLGLEAQAVLLGENEGHSRLIDDLGKSYSIMGPGATMVKVNTADSFQQKNPQPALLAVYQKAEPYLAITGKFLRTQDIRVIRDFVDCVMSFKTLDPAFFTTKPAMVLALLANHLEATWNMLFPTGARIASVVNAVNVPIPDFLDARNAPAFIDQYVRNSVYDKFVVEFASTLKVTISDLFTRNERTLIYELSEQIGKKVLDVMLDAYNTVSSKYETFERHWTRRASLIPTYTKLTVDLAARGLREMSMLDKKLVRCYLVSDASVDATPGYCFYTNHDTQEALLHSFDAVSRRLSDILPLIDDCLSACFTSDMSYWLSGYSMVKGHTQRNDLIHRITKLKGVDSKITRFIQFEPAGSNRKIRDIEPLSLTVPSVYEGAKNYIDDDTFSTAKLGTGQAVQCHTSQYDVAVVGLDRTMLYRSLLQNATFVLMEYDDLGTAVSAYADCDLFTILPPAIGSDNLSFGSSVQNRRQNISKKFTIERVTHETHVDTVDLLMAFPGREVLSIQDDSDKLKACYEKRLGLLVQPAQAEPADVISDIWQIRVFDAYFDYLFKTFASESPERSIGILHDTFFLPSNTTLADLQQKALPRCVQVPRFLDMDVILPASLLSPQIIVDLRVSGEAKGPRQYDGRPIIEVLPLDGYSGDFEISHVVSDPRAVYEAEVEVTERVPKLDDNGQPVMKKLPDGTETPVMKKIKVKKTKVTPFGRLLDAFGRDATFVVVRFHVDTKYNFKYPAFGKALHPKLQFTAVPANQQVLYIDYNSIALNNGVKLKYISAIRGVTAAALSEGIVRKNLFDMEVGVNGSYQLPVKNSVSYVKALLLSYVVAEAQTFGPLHDSTCVDIKVVCDELLEICDYLDSAYHPDTSLMSLGVLGTTAVGVFTGTVRQFINDPDYERGLECLRILDPFIESKITTYALELPPAVGKLEKGFARDILSGTITAMAMPTVATSMLTDYWDYFFVQQIGSEFSHLFVRKLNDAVAAAI